MPETPIVNIAKVKNHFVRMMRFHRAGDIEHGHQHQSDHLTLLATGALRVTVEGAATEFRAPHMIYIHKDKNHELVALEDNTIAYCIHALREKDTGDILDPSMIPVGVEHPDLGIVQPILKMPAPAA